MIRLFKIGIWVSFCNFWENKKKEGIFVWDTFVALTEVPFASKYVKLYCHYIDYNAWLKAGSAQTWVYVSGLKKSVKKLRLNPTKTIILTLFKMEDSYSFEQPHNVSGDQDQCSYCGSLFVPHRDNHLNISLSLQTFTKPYKKCKH